jgi:Protein of unknown function (DUF4242)
MPIFLDSHHAAELPLDVLRAFLRDARNSATDNLGVTALDIYCGEDGRVFCVLAAPNEAAIRRRHESHGVRCGRVLRVPSSSSSTQDLSAEEKAVVRQMIAAETEWSSLRRSSPSTGSGGWLRQVG